jgi:hypothetical protein
LFIISTGSRGQAGEWISLFDGKTLEGEPAHDEKSTRPDFTSPEISRIINQTG